jgi:hypothetical protein
MKLNSDDVLKLRSALAACKLAGVEDAVIHEGLVRGLNPQHHGAIFSTIELSIDPSVAFGIGRLVELEKRMKLFGDNILIEGELTDTNLVKKLTLRGASSKIEFRCTDPKLLKYPKTNTDQEMAVVQLTKPEIALIAKSVKTIGAEQVTFQVRKDGQVRVEAMDQNNDRFETELSVPAEFIEAPYPAVNNFDCTNAGVLLGMLEHLASQNDVVSTALMRSGQFKLQAHKHTLLAIPKIQYS